ncbi:hypothetical protein D3C86_1451930 [compost metagenome]
MARLGFEQRDVELAQLLVQIGRQPVEALAGARLYVGADDQGVHQLARLVLADVRVQALGVLRSADRPVSHATLLHQFGDLLEMTQLLARQA